MSRILIVDDNPVNLEVLKSTLKVKGYEVIPFQSAASALEFLIKETPDLILLDIMMPEMSGFDLFTEIRKIEILKKIPIIFISALDDNESIDKGFRMGASDFITKPFRSAEVTGRVGNHLALMEAQKKLYNANIQLQEAAAVFEVSGEGIVITGPDGVIRRVNPSFSEITGYSPEEVIGQKPSILKSGRHNERFYKKMWNTLITEGFWEAEIWNRRKDGTIFPEWQMIRTIKSEDGEIQGFISQFSDITRRKLTEEEIRYRGNYDVLTGLINRSFLMDRLDQAIKSHRRNKKRFNLLLIDLDKFKHVNDTMGHVTGDLLLQKAALRIKDEIRETDAAARLGGDEFVVLLPDVEKKNSGERAGIGILNTLSEPFDLNGREALIGASIGIVVFPDDGDTAESLMRNADLALYRAKESGRNQLQFFTETMEKEYIEKRQLESDLRKTMKENKFMVYYQPIVNLKTTEIEGVEALARWQHPELGFIHPPRFIQIAEEFGLINQLGLWIIEEVCRQIGKWKKNGINLYATINISAQQIPGGISLEWLEKIMAEEDLSVNYLIFEVTESVFIKDIEPVADWIRQARRMGFKIYLDDFGTGYSSLSYLKKFPVDAVKIDKIFIKELANDNSDQALVRAILAMSDGLGLNVVAEGIESESQARILNEFNCPKGQGYLYSEPIPPEEIEKIVNQFDKSIHF